MSVSPVFLELEEGTRSSGTITVTNPTESRLPVTINIAAMSLDQNGRAGKLTAANNDFVTIPVQASIAPGATQDFRVQYVGAATLSSSRLFQYSIDQLPIQPAPGAASQIQIVYSVSGFMAVAPIAGRSAMAVTGTGVTTDRAGKRHATVTFANRGTRHVLISRGSLTVRQVGPSGETVWRQSLNAARIDKEVGLGIVPANGSRTITLPYDLPAAGGAIEAEYDNGRQK
jgi:P pilus assembly chaperone PapD